MNRLIPHLALSFGLAALAAGCDAEFDPYTRLNSLRVLALKSDPPTPGLGETATLSALTFVPDEQTTTFAWSWCPAPGDARDGYPCLINEAQFRALLGGAEVPNFDLGTGETASFAHKIPDATLKALCEPTTEMKQAMGAALAAIDCKGGLGVQINLVARGLKKADGQQVDEVRAVHTLRLRYGSIGANTNPVIDSLTGLEPPVALDDANSGTVQFARKKKSKVAVTVKPEMSETYEGTNDDGKAATLREKLIFSWFTETGDLKYQRTSFIDGQITLDAATRNEWEPELLKDYARTTSKVIVVIRDDRGGVSWKSGLVNLEAK